MNSLGKGCLWIAGIAAAGVVGLVLLVGFLMALGSTMPATTTIATTEPEPQATAKAAPPNPFRGPVLTKREKDLGYFVRCEDMPENLQGVLVRALSRLNGNRVSRQEAVDWLNRRVRQLETERCDEAYLSAIPALTQLGVLETEDFQR